MAAGRNLCYLAFYFSHLRNRHISKWNEYAITHKNDPMDPWFTRIPQLNYKQNQHSHLGTFLLQVHNTFNAIFENIVSLKEIMPIYNTIVKHKICNEFLDSKGFGQDSCFDSYFPVSQFRHKQAYNINTAHESDMQIVPNQLKGLL